MRSPMAGKQFEDLALGQVLARDLPMHDCVDAEQGLVDVERAAHGLHGAAGTEQQERLGTRVDLLAEVSGDVLLDGVLLHAGDDRLGGLHIGRLERRPGRHVESYRPFITPIFFLVEVENFYACQSNLLR